MAREFSTKRLAIDKANATLVLAVGIAAFISVFCIVASKSLLDQRAYQQKVIDKKETALKTLKSNVKAADDLTISYETFARAGTNVLGGNPSGDADRDGDNPRIILDALPSKYDFPALTTSVHKILKENGLIVKSIEGTDDEVSQAGNEAAATPQPVEMPFVYEVESTPTQGKTALEIFERSIRPIQVQKVTIKVEGGNLVTKVEAKSFYQPGKSLNIQTEVIKQ